MKKKIIILALLLLAFGVSQAQDIPFGHKNGVTKSMFPDDTLKVGSPPDSAVFIYHGRIIKAVWQGSPFSMAYVENLSHTLDSLGILIDMLSIIGTDTSLYRTNTNSGMMKYGDLAMLLGKMDSTRVNDLLALKANIATLGTMAYADSLFWKSLIVITNAILKDSLYASGNSSEYLNGQFGWTTPGGLGNITEADSVTKYVTPYQLDTTYNILEAFINERLAATDTTGGSGGSATKIVTLNYLLTQAYLQEITGLHLDNVFSGTGILKRTGATTYSTMTDNSTNWDNGYLYRVISAAGTYPLQLTLAGNALTGRIIDGMPLVDGAGVDSSRINTWYKIPAGYAASMTEIDSIIIQGISIDETARSVKVRIDYGYNPTLTGTLIDTVTVTSHTAVTKQTGSQMIVSLIPQGASIYLSFPTVTTAFTNITVRLYGHYLETGLPLLDGTAVDTTRQNTWYKVPAGYAAQTIVIDSVIYQGISNDLSTRNVTALLTYTTDASAAGDTINSVTITSHTAATKQSGAQLTNATVPAGNSIFLTFPAVTKPFTILTCRIFGHYQ